jgi:benzoyl-CoA 2,3-dioxygenase component B
MGIHSGGSFDPDGNPISEEEFKARRDEWLPTEKDREYIKNLMKPVLEPGKMANWVAAPARGVHGKPVEFEYIRRA